MAIVPMLVNKTVKRMGTIRIPIYDASYTVPGIFSVQPKASGTANGPNRLFQRGSHWPLLTSPLIPSTSTAPIILTRLNAAMCGVLAPTFLLNGDQSTTNGTVGLRYSAVYHGNYLDYAMKTTGNGSFTSVSTGMPYNVGSVNFPTQIFDANNIANESAGTLMANCAFYQSYSARNQQNQIVSAFVGTTSGFLWRVQTYGPFGGTQMNMDQNRLPGSTTDLQYSLKAFTIYPKLASAKQPLDHSWIAQHQTVAGNPWTYWFTDNTWATWYGGELTLDDASFQTVFQPGTLAKRSSVVQATAWGFYIQMPVPINTGGISQSNFHLYISADFEWWAPIVLEPRTPSAVAALSGAWEDECSFTIDPNGLFWLAYAPTASQSNFAVDTYIGTSLEAFFSLPTVPPMQNYHLPEINLSCYSTCQTTGTYEIKD